jgi:hypothetical protein
MYLNQERREHGKDTPRERTGIHMGIALESAMIGRQYERAEAV